MIFNLACLIYFLNIKSQDARIFLQMTQFIPLYSEAALRGLLRPQPLHPLGALPRGCCKEFC